MFKTATASGLTSGVHLGWDYMFVQPRASGERITYWKTNAIALWGF